MRKCQLDDDYFYDNILFKGNILTHLENVTLFLFCSDSGDLPSYKER